MRKCPYCAEEIQDEAVKCRYCGEFLEKEIKKVPWFFKTRVIVIAFLCVGPFALPMVWFNPRFSRKTKIVVSVIIVVISYILYIVTVNALKSIGTYYGDIFDMLKTP